MNPDPSKVKLINILRNQTNPRKNRSYKSWWILNRRKVGWQMHHLLHSTKGKTGKISDLLLVNVTWEQHERIHYGTGYNDGEFEQLLCEALNDKDDYIEVLQERLHK